MSARETSEPAPDPARSLPRRGARPGVAIAAVLAGYALAVGFSRAFTLPAELLTAAGCLGGCLVAWRRQFRPRPAVDRARMRPGRAIGWRDRAAWGGVVLIALGYELAALAFSPRAMHPTLSSLADDAGATTLGRAALALGWVVLLGLALR